MLPKLGKDFCKAAWGKGGKEARRRFHLVSSFRIKAFSGVTVPSFKSPSTTSGIQNPGFLYRTGAARQKNGISGSTDEQDAVLVSAQDVLTGSLWETPRRGHLFLSGWGEQEGVRSSGVAVVRGAFLREGNHLARRWQPGLGPPFPDAQLATAGPGSLRSAAPQGAPGAGPRCRRARCQARRWWQGANLVKNYIDRWCSENAPSVEKSCIN